MNTERQLNSLRFNLDIIFFHSSSLVLLKNNDLTSVITTFKLSFIYQFPHSIHTVQYCILDHTFNTIELSPKQRIK